MVICTITIASGITKTTEVAAEDTPVASVVATAVREGLLQYAGVVATAVTSMRQGGVDIGQKDKVGEGALEVCVTRRVIRNESIPREILIKMYTRENELRCSPATQARYTEHAIPFNSDVTSDLQRQVLQEFDLPGSDEALRLYHSQRHHYRGDKEVRDVPLFIRHDISCEGALREGDPFVDVRLVHANGNSVQLQSFVKGKPLVIVAGSYS